MELPWWMIILSIAIFGHNIMILNFGYRASLVSSRQQHCLDLIQNVFRIKALRAALPDSCLPDTAFILKVNRSAERKRDLTSSVQHWRT